MTNRDYLFGRTSLDLPDSGSADATSSLAGLGSGYFRGEAHSYSTATSTLIARSEESRVPVVEAIGAKIALPVWKAVSCISSDDARQVLKISTRRRCREAVRNWIDGIVYTHIAMPFIRSLSVVRQTAMPSFTQTGLRIPRPQGPGSRFGRDKLGSSSWTGVDAGDDMTELRATELP